MQLKPSDLHTGAPQTPLEHCPVQHCEAEVQLLPSELHTGAPQTPLEHCPVQHCEAEVQPVPSDRHTGGTPHVPAWHTLLQQFDAAEHEAPSALHVYVALQSTGGTVRQLPGNTYWLFTSLSWSTSSPLLALIDPTGVRSPRCTVVTPS